MSRTLVVFLCLLAAAAMTGCDDDETAPLRTPRPTRTPAPEPPTATATETAVPPTPTPTLSGNPIRDLPVDETVRLMGLDEPVDVVFDELGIPHVFGPDLDTVLFVQGYLTAQARFWEMDALRRVAEGRLAELFGNIGGGLIDTDVEMRTVFTTRDGRRIEDALWERLQADDPEGAASLQAYTDGINTWINDVRTGQNGATLPAEYRFPIVGLTADDLAEWRPQDTVALGRFQAFSLSESLGEDINNARRLAALPEALRRDVFRFAPAAPATVLPPSEGAASTAVAARPALPPANVLDAALQVVEHIRRMNPLGDRDRSVGSNNWIVAPSLSASGHAMLANDPHLSLINPPVWHMIQLDAAGDEIEDGENLRANGVIFPGIPGIILGHNDYGAWGGTVSVFDVTDVYIETVTTPEDYPTSPRTVLFNGEQVPVLRVEETFIVKGEDPRTYVIEVVPHHGPMVPDPDLDDDVVGLAATGMSFRWTGHEITLDSKFLLDLNKARSVDEFRAALQNFAAGGQNWIWADISGDIAYFPYVLVPQRPFATTHPPYLPLPGTGEAEWLADDEGNTLWLPGERFPQALNPAAGYLATANNDQIGNSLDNDPLNDELYWAPSFDLGFREQRIQELLSNAAGLREEGAPITMADMARYQYDNQSKEAQRLVPFLLAAAAARPDDVTPAMSEALGHLEEWGTAKPGSAPGAVAYDTVSGVDPADTRTDVPPRDPPVSDEERADAAATSIFAVWSGRLARLTFDDDFAGTGFGTPGGDDATKALLHLLEDVGRTEPGFVIHTAGDDGQSTLWDDKTTEAIETRDQILLAALGEAIERLTEQFGSEDQSTWLWGTIHKVRLQHFFGQGGIDSFNLGDFEAPGGRFTVNPAGYGLTSTPPFIFSGGPSMRFVVDLDPDGIKAINSLPGGNNGAPGPNAAAYARINPAVHYGDHLPGWINGTTFELHVSREDVAANSDRHIRYVPSGG